MKHPPTDSNTTVSDLKQVMAAFVRQRDWEKYHRPKNLAMSLAVETAELMEHFQWTDHAEAEALLAAEGDRGEIADEMADVLSFLLSLANATGIDLAGSFCRKMARNERKYPADEVRGYYRRPRKERSDG